MTALTLYRVPRRALRKLAKPALLWLNAWRFQQSEFELARRRQVKLRLQRIQIAGW